MIVVLLFLRECVYLLVYVCVCVCVAAAARAREEINTIVGLCATCVYFAAGFLFCPSFFLSRLVNIRA